MSMTQKVKGLFSSMCAFILGQGDVSPDLPFILLCQLSSLRLLLSCWLILSPFLEGRIYIFLEGTNITLHYSI